ncbi:MAG: glycosyltransferase [Bacteroidetes bacterium]|nr:glycosyltransferase [Bacteroidota bacterium]
MRKIKVLHISAADPYTGAGGAALKLHLSLLRNDIDSRLLFLKDPCNESKEVFSFVDNIFKRCLRFVYTTLDRLPTWFYRKRSEQIFSPGIFGLSLLSHPMFIWADIIQFHWVNHGFVNINELRKLNKPIFWTMHDMWAFTGGCHYAMFCEKYKTSCGKCPILKSTTKHDLSYWVLRNKQKKIPVDRIKWIAISSWMADLASKSNLLKDATINIIYSGIDSKIFAPKNKDSARKDLMLPLNKRIILLGADNLLSPFKGIQFSLDALRLIDSEYIIVTFGNGQIPKEQLSQTVIHMGYISDHQKLASLYSAADLFLATSVAEAFGMTVAEAQCCGTPVIAFDTLGPKDIIEHKTTGYLAEMGSITDLAIGINFCLTSKLNSDRIRERAIELFSIDNCAKKYIELYSACLNENQLYH